jgi:hypothetical protein
MFRASSSCDFLFDRVIANLLLYPLTAQATVS